MSRHQSNPLSRTSGRSFTASFALTMIALAMIVAACGGSGGDDQTIDDQTSEGQTSEGQVSDEAANETDATETDTTETGAADDTTDATAPSVESPLDEIVIEAAPAGPRPLLSWAAVDGAALYRVVVVDADGAPYWAWSGSETQVFVGGVDDPALPGAVVFESMTWTVVALDEDGLPLSISDVAPLEP